MNTIDYQAERQKYLQAILDSDAQYKIIVAGPGTGKTFSFKKVLEHIGSSNNLVLTFINDLVNDLNKELSSMADVRTFHSFSKQALHKNLPDDLKSDFFLYPKINQIIEYDYRIVNENINNSKKYFEELDENDGVISKFLKRGSYYNTIGFDDCVYRILKQFESNHDNIPSYEIILIDEYQDFNLLEVSLIDLLSTKSKTLIVGDDDQALYDQLKSAKADYLREKFISSLYKNFQLPFCSRCTEVIVTAVNNIVKTAQKKGMLTNRIHKSFICYKPDKEIDNTMYPYIKHIKCSIHTKKCPYIAKYIESEINKISNDDIQDAKNNNIPCVLIVGPSHILKGINEYLLETGYIVESKNSLKNFSLIDSLGYLNCDIESNIGWRIIIEGKYLTYLDNIIKESFNKQFVNLVPQKFKDEVGHILSLYKKFLNNKLNLMEETEFVEYANLQIAEIKQHLFEGCIQDDAEQLHVPNKDISIKITTFQGSKGLQSNHVFLVGLVNGILPLNHREITDKEICQFIVGLTRARKQCQIISCQRIFGKIFKDSDFINWIGNNNINYKYVDKSYFN